MKTKKTLSGIIAVTLFLASCTKDSGDLLGDARDKFTGSWTCKETIQGSSSPSIPFTVIISKSGNSDTVKLKNFSNYGDFTSAIGLVSGNSIVIPNQNIGVTNIPVGGSGIYSGSGSTVKINFNYTTDGQNATAVYSR